MPRPHVARSPSSGASEPAAKSPLRRAVLDSLRGGRARHSEWISGSAWRQGAVRKRAALARPAALPLGWGLCTRAVSALSALWGCVREVEAAARSHRHTQELSWAGRQDWTATHAMAQGGDGGRAPALAPRALAVEERALSRRARVLQWGPSPLLPLQTTQQGALVAARGETSCSPPLNHCSHSTCQGGKQG